MKRSLFVASSLAAVSLGGCTNIGNALNESRFHGALTAAEDLNRRVIGTRGMAKTYAEADIDRDFRINGFDTPHDARYAGFVGDHFRSYRLAVTGLVERRRTFALPELRALASLTQITRHDCVEGWSAIGKWSGVPLHSLLQLVRPKENARYVVFHCMDRSDDGTPYYESLDLIEAAHPQTVLALDLNGKALDPDHGAPVRLRVPTQLGYKSAKWIDRIELAADFKSIFAGKGGYWEDQGYEWYAGI